MPNPFTRGFKYFLASLSGRLDERADPRIQIEQAIEEAQRQHQALTQQAAAVIGNQRQIEMKLSRQLASVEQLQGSARQSLVLADAARAQGDTQRAQQYEQAAQSFASQLVAAEAAVTDLKTLHDQALGAADAAKRAVENNAVAVQSKLRERSQLLTQLEAAKMQEQVSRSLESMSTLAAPTSTPTLGEVRDKIERRYATALGQAELASTSVEARMLEVEKVTYDVAGASRLDQIRASLAAERAAEPPQPSPTGVSAEDRPALGAAETTPTLRKPSDPGVGRPASP